MSRKEIQHSDEFNQDDNLGDYIDGSSYGETEDQEREETSVFNDIIDADDSDAFADFDSYEFATPTRSHKEFASIYDAETQKRRIIKLTIFFSLTVVALLIFYFTSAYFKLYATEKTYGPISFDSTQQFELVYDEHITNDNKTYDDMVVASDSVRVKVMTTHLTPDMLTQLENSEFAPSSPTPEQMGMKEGRYNYQGNIRYYGGVELTHGNVDRAYYTIIDINNSTKYNVSIYGDRLNSSEIVNIYKSLKFDGKPMIDYH